MRKILYGAIAITSCLLSGIICNGQKLNNSDTEISDAATHKLWFNKPADFFEESLVLGNGKVGASVFGGVNSDQIYLNDATLWAGEPVGKNNNTDAHKFIPKIREALANEDYELADKLNRNVQGEFSESFAPLGTLFLEFEHHGKAQNFYRELDISNGVSKTTYEVDGVKFSREYFISHPDEVMLVKLSADKQEALNFTVKFNSLLKYTSVVKDKVLKAEGYAPYHAEPNYRGDMPNAVQFDENRGTRFSSYFKVKNKGGEQVFTDSSIVVKGASEAILYVSIATSFNGFDKDPAKEGLDNKAIAQAQLNKAFEKEYAQIKDAHIADVQKFMGRVELNLGESTAPKLPTDERLKRYFHGEEDKNLEILYFQYGRYLLVSSSRTEGVPANLQGIWNPYMRPPWSSNYTMNINAEENYWMAETANLSEMHQPFLGFIGNLAKTGEATAKDYYGVDKGWAACHNSDIWAQSNPVGDYGNGNPKWACWNMSGAWSVTHLWEHYQFTQDTTFLKNDGYPLMKGAAEFCLNWLVKDKKGNLLTSPSTSPENSFVTDKGYEGATLYGATADLAMIRECFQQVIEASEVLGVDDDFRKELEMALTKMYPYQIGKKGNLQEWYYDWDDADPQHRHQSHLYGLHPGGHITPELTPELAEACKKSLEIKGDESTGWSKGWRINLWARLQDGNHAYKMYRELLSFVDPSGLKTEYSKGGGTYPNLFDAHPPFQIDGNFGGSAGVVEMLLQSHQKNIHLLPALPDAWPQGLVKGLCARGGFVIDMEWNEGKLAKVNVTAKNGGKTTLIYQGKSKELNLAKGESVGIKWD
ncbi:glycoside hydrolase family 95 protein [uncultured Draconibacterium sp.]|uniref:glycoside hydrolase family 95 protein n=1 Tax=uncultured Draconibacterium sp. TaxID=1573823 RepID=UPI0025DA9302|nr:glycoside hydrolase family 95 protein [uncultured Draconibacterium sp.]